MLPYSCCQNFRTQNVQTQSYNSDDDDDFGGVLSAEIWASTNICPTCLLIQITFLCAKFSLNDRVDLGWQSPECFCQYNLPHVYVKSIMKMEREKSVYDLNSFQLKGGTERNLKKWENYSGLLRILASYL